MFTPALSLDVNLPSASIMYWAQNIIAHIKGALSSPEKSAEPNTESTESEIPSNVASAQLILRT